MIKKILSIGVVAAMVACGNAGESSHDHDHDHGTEAHSHENDGHEHEAHDHEGHSHEAEETTNENRLMVAEGANVFFVNLKDGDVVSSPVKVEMGVSGMEVEPAGAANTGFGHHHILINNEVGFLDPGVVVPADENNIHYGKGQTETELELAPGMYKLSLQFANGFHESYGEQMSASINITVE